MADAADNETSSLQIEYEILREDDRSLTNAQAALASIFAALLAGLAAIAVGDCKFRAVGETQCYQLDPLAFLIMPCVPLAVLCYILMLSAEKTVKFFYLRAIENELRLLHNSPLTGLTSLLPMSSAEIATTVTSPRRGRGAYRALFAILAGGFIVSLGGLIVLIAAKLGGLWSVLMILFYAPIFLFLVYNALSSSLRGRRLLQDSVAALVQSGEYPRLVFPPDTRPVDAPRSLIAYLLLPRVAEIVKSGIIVFAFALALISDPAPVSFSSAAVSSFVAAWVGFEFLIYQSRYQWNDIRGVVDDMLHPARDHRQRLPTARFGVRASVLASCVGIAIRLALAVLLVTTVGRQYQWANAFIVASVATWLVAFAYEAVRSTRRFTPQLQARLVWLLVGGGYAIRAGLGLALAEVGFGVSLPPVSAGLSILSAGIFGIMFVTLTWLLEGVGHCYGRLPVLEYKGGPYPSLADKDHILQLLPFAGIYAREVQTVGEDVPSARNLRPLTKGGQKLAPWNIALIFAATSGVAGVVSVQSLPPRAAILGVPTLCASAVISGAAVTLATGILMRWTFAVVGTAVLATEGGVFFGWSGAVSVGVICAIYFSAYSSFMQSDYASLAAFPEQLEGLVKYVIGIPRAIGRTLLQVFMGKRTWDEVKR